MSKVTNGFRVEDVAHLAGPLRPLTTRLLPFNLLFLRPETGTEIHKRRTSKW